MAEGQHATRRKASTIDRFHPLSALSPMSRIRAGRISAYKWDGKADDDNPYSNDTGKVVDR